MLAWMTVAGTTQVVAGDPRIAEALEAAAEFFRDYLWTSEIGASVLRRIGAEGIEEETLRAFGVGYVPGGHRLLLEHLAERGYSEADLHAAGIATRSARGRVHPQFRSRVMFPIRDRGGEMLGFAGMATNPGASWPLWLISPDRGRFQKRTAIFAIDRAAGPISRTGRAVMFRDCLDVLRMHQSGHEEAVAVMRCSISPGHVSQIGQALGVLPTELALEEQDGQGGVIVRPQPGGEEEQDRRPATTASRDRRRTSASELRPDPIKTRSPAARAFLQFARGALGLGIPLAWLAIIRPDPQFSGGADPAFIGAVGGVAATYVVLAIVGALAAARIRARSRARRMRGPWEMGLTEWQPLAWTYHMLEDILIGAAIVSILVCTALFLLMGGFTR